jgi:hypothetical protein
MIKSPISIVSIYKDEVFSLDGKMSPTFYNVGTTQVSIGEIVILAGGFRSFDYAHVVLQGTIEVRFISANEKNEVNHVVVDYISYRESKKIDSIDSNC